MITRSPTSADGVVSFVDDVERDHQDYHAGGLDNLYRCESNHFWFIARRQFISDAFRKYVAKSKSILEIGAGTGSVARQLISDGYDVSVGELHRSGLEYAQSYGVSRCYQFDVYDPPFSDHFDVICMFDVLEHLDDRRKVLKNILEMLSSGGMLMLTVPAHMWLWSRDDAVASHKIRYERASLISDLEDAGFEIIEVRYFFILILPLLWARRIIRPDDGGDVQMDELEGEIVINPVLNRLLLWVSRLERHIHTYIPNFSGGSLIAVAIKK